MCVFDRRIRVSFQDPRTVPCGSDVEFPRMGRGYFVGIEQDEILRRAQRHEVLDEGVRSLSDSQKESHVLLFADRGAG